MSQKKTELCNLPEDFTREIRYLLLYDAKNFTFNQNLKGLVPPADNFLLKIFLHNASSYGRNIDIKQENDNDYFDIKITFPIFDVSRSSRMQLFDFHKKRKYVAVLVSQQETLALGNHREPLTLTVDDHIKDNGSGKDSLNITLRGQSIIFPTIGKITEKFRVLFFLPPMK